MLTKSNVSSLYVSLFGRASESLGNQYWISQSANKSMSQIADDMLATLAAKKYFGDTLNDNFKFINFIYENTLNKSYYENNKGMEVDKAGIEYWTELLNSNKYTKGEVSASMIQSIYDKKYENLNAAKLFKNKVMLSDKIADAVKSEVKVNELKPFIDAVNKVKANSTVADIDNLVREVAGGTPKPQNKDGYHWEVATAAQYPIFSKAREEKHKETKSEFSKLVIHSNKTGIINLDKMPDIISIDGIDIEAIGHHRDTSGTGIQHVLNPNKGWLPLLTPGAVVEFQIGRYNEPGHRYVLINKTEDTPETYDDNLNLETDVMIRIAGVPESNQDYYYNISEVPTEIGLI
ncbi:hypothetical protein [Campylobacter sp. RM15925]|uniref:hypothetical protein n=1 Tax=Campylobacter sp. RM15925 TaxID=1705724 RepID=UPI0014764D84|nr:hypothetical protein [Campylobacter sp. RM15925]